MLKTKFVPTPINWTKRRKSVVLPNQSMTIQEILKRFVRGVPVDVTQRKPVYVDQNNEDLEKLGRMEPSEQAYMAEQLRGQALNLSDQIEADKREASRQAQERSDRAKDKAAAQAEGAGIDNLDNTMPVDTDLTERKLGVKKKRSSD